MEIVKNLKDDEMLIQACKKLYRTFTFSSHPIDMEEGTVDLRHEEFERLIELAEIGKNAIQGIYGEVVENKREEDAEHSEEQPEPHFKYNEDCTFDCSKCLCNTCLNYKGDLAEACAESCCNLTCHNDYYVDSCPAYNDGHNF